MRFQQAGTMKERTVAGSLFFVRHDQDIVELKDDIELKATFNLGPYMYKGAVK